MRIAFLADSSLPHTLRWANHFAQCGHEAVVLSLEAPAGDYACPVVQLRNRRPLPAFARYSLAVPEAAARVRAFAPDVVNAHFVPNYGFMAAAARLQPLVVTTLGSDILVVPGRSPLHHARTRFVLHAARAVTSDAAMLTGAIAAFGVEPARILTVPFGIESHRFRDLPVRPAAPAVVLSTRRLEPLYDVGTLLRAWASLEPEMRALTQLRVAGSGSEEAALRQDGGPLGAEFLGWLTPAQLDAELAAAHIYVSASHSDSTSVSLLEAMAAGCFPVLSDIPANREWIDDGTSGLLFPPGDAAALAACIRRALTDPGLRESAAVHNRAVIDARGRWEPNMQQVEALFASVAQRPEGGGPRG